MKRARNYSAIILAGMLAAVTLATSPAHAESATVSEITVSDNAGPTKSVLTLTFDKPIREAEADKIEAGLRADGPSPVRVQATGDKMWCWGSIVDQDANASFDIQYSCNSPRTLAWGLKLKPAVQRIVVGNVSEGGLTWWRNLAYAGKNAPHTVPPSYLFHGTMNPVYAGNDIDYQDYLTFRHNVGSGGTGSVTWAGSVVLQN